jgi:hypothetical protein
VVDQPRPKDIKRFECLAYSAWGLTIASAPLNWSTIVKYYHKGGIIYLTAIAFALGLQAGWIWLIARKRKNWARWIGLILVIAGLPSLPFEFEVRFEADPLAASAYYTEYLIWVCAICFTFTSEARAWFRRSAVERVAETGP